MPTPTSPRLVQRTLVAVGLIALAFVHRIGFASPVGASAAGSALDHALHDPSMLEPVLALLASVLLLGHRRVRLAAALGGGRTAASGWIVLGLGAVLLVWSRQIDGPHLVLPALLLSLVGGALVAGGWPLLHVVAWPLAPLALAAPLPPQLMNAVLFPLQLLTVSLTSTLLDLVGRAHEVRGDLLITRGITFQVIEGCSGFKTMLSLALAAIVYGELVLERPAARAALVLAAIPLGLAANAVRVLVLILAEIPADSPDHMIVGLAVLVGSVVVLACGELVVSKGLMRMRAPSPSTPPTADRVEAVEIAGNGRRAGAVGALWIGLACLAEGLPIGNWPLARGVINIETLPEEIAGRTSQALAVDTKFLGTTSFGHHIARTYAAPARADAPPSEGAAHREVDEVRVFVGHEDVARLDRTGYSPKTMLPGSGWQRFTRVATDEDDAHAQAGWSRWNVDYPTRRVQVLQWRPGYAPWGLESAARWLGLDRIRATPARRSPLVVRLEREDRGGDPVADWLILRQFAREIEDWYRRSGA